MASRRLNERLAKYNYLYNDDIILTSDKQPNDSYTNTATQETNGSSSPSSRNEHRSAVNGITATTTHNNNNQESSRVTQNGDRVNSELTAIRLPTITSNYSSTGGPRGALLGSLTASTRSATAPTNSDYSHNHRNVSLMVR